MGRMGRRSLPVVALLAIAACSGGDKPAGETVATDSTDSAKVLEVSNCDGETTDPKMDGVSYQLPEDAEVSVELGPITIATTSPVTITDLENGTYLQFMLTNSSKDDVLIRIPNVFTMENSRPEWVLHMSLIRDYELTAEGHYELLIPGDGFQTVTVYMSRDAAPGRVEDNWSIAFELPELGSRVDVPILLRSVQGEFGPDGKRIPASASIRGRVFDEDGQPLANAEVTAFLASGELRRYTKTDFYGRFSLPLVSDSGLSQISGGRQLSPTAVWNLTVDAEGHNLWSLIGLSLAQAEVRDCDVRLSTVKPWQYELKVTIESPNGYGAWDSHFFGAGDRFVVAPGIHGPDDAIAPIAIRAYDLQGNELWNVPINSVRDYGVWQMSTSRDGRFIAATSHDGYLRVISEAGEVVHEQRIFNRQNSAAGTQFSPDGTRLATSSDNGIIVLDTVTWEPVWTSRSNMYRGFWSDTEAGLVAGSIDGLITSYSPDGEVRWRRGAGLVPFHVFVDESGRTTVAGKARYMRSWDKNGVPLWSSGVAHTSNRTSLRRGASDNGELIVSPTFNGLDQAFDGDGNLLWMRWLPVQEEPDPAGGKMLRVPGPGHDATYVAPDGSFIVQGTRANQVLVYNGDGSLLWKSELFPNKPGYPDGGHYTPGANTVLASADGKYIIAGFADAVIRVFVRS